MFSVGRSVAKWLTDRGVCFRGHPGARRTMLGLAVAMAVAILVLVNYHLVKPWLFRHDIKAFFSEDTSCAIKAVIAFSALGLSVWVQV